MSKKTVHLKAFRRKNLLVEQTYMFLWSLLNNCIHYF